MNLSFFNQFLDENPFMSITPSDLGFMIKGKFRFSAETQNIGEITNSFYLEILIPNNFPKSLPKIKETQNKIPRSGDYHVNPDGTFCLGSPIRLMQKIKKDSTMSGFVKNCLIPYLYAVSYKLKNGGNFIFGELKHGKSGLFDDGLDLFGLDSPNKVEKAISLLGLKKRYANKKICPCGCGKRLGICSFRFKLDNYRKLAPVSWFKAIIQSDWKKL